jgi:hypothetical protein
MYFQATIARRSAFLLFNNMPFTIFPLTTPPTYITSLLQYIAPLFTLTIRLHMRAPHFHRKSPCFELHSLGGHVPEVFFGEVIIVRGLGTRLDSVSQSDSHWGAGKYCREVFRWWATGFMNSERVESFLSFSFAEGVEESTKCHSGVVGAASTGGGDILKLFVPGACVYSVSFVIRA